MDNLQTFKFSTPRYVSGLGFEEDEINEITDEYSVVIDQTTIYYKPRGGEAYRHRRCPIEKLHPVHLRHKHGSLDVIPV